MTSNKNDGSSVVIGNTEVALVEDQDVIFEGEPLTGARIDAIVDDVHAEMYAKRQANLPLGGRTPI